MKPCHATNMEDGCACCLGFTSRRDYAGQPGARERSERRPRCVVTVRDCAERARQAKRTPHRPAAPRWGATIHWACLSQGVALVCPARHLRCEEFAPSRNAGFCSLVYQAFSPIRPAVYGGSTVANSISSASFTRLLGPGFSHRLRAEAER